MDIYVYMNGAKKGEKVVQTRSVAMGVMVDLDKDGNVLGVEVLNADRVDADGKKIS